VGRAGREGVAITLVEPREHSQLRNIERLTGHRIEIAKVPTVADLRTRRLELTRASLQEALVAEDNEHFRVIVDALSGEYDPVQIAMAAVKLYHEATVGDTEQDENDAPPGPLPREREGKKKREPVPYGLGRGNGDMAKIYIGAGRQAGVRPQDLVGAIANEAGVAGALIGAIQIADRFSLVEVPEDVANEVIRALGNSTIRGKKVQVRRDKGQ
jgi:ATP-dependent RNA helicase DeaD